jgi:hypothetical protein
MRGVESDQAGPRIFSLTEARALLPEVKAITADAVRRVQTLTEELRSLPQGDSSQAVVEGNIQQTVDRWARQVQGMGLEAKGTWLVDFDNGKGYYCWCYPEETISHFHDYDAGFRGRMKIV